MNMDREVEVLFRSTFSGLSLTETASPRGGVGSIGRRMASPQRECLCSIEGGIRPGCLASLPSDGEAQIGVIRKPTTLRGNV